MSRDEKLVQEMNIPCSVEEIISKPMEEFNDLLSRHSVSEDVINVCRDIRRRGKNKVGFSLARVVRSLSNLNELDGAHKL